MIIRGHTQNNIMVHVLWGLVLGCVLSVAALDDLAQSVAAQNVWLLAPSQDTNFAWLNGTLAAIQSRLQLPESRVIYGRRRHSFHESGQALHLQQIGDDAAAAGNISSTFVIMFPADQLNGGVQDAVDRGLRIMTIYYPLLNPPTCPASTGLSSECVCSAAYPVCWDRGRETGEGSNRRRRAGSCHSANMTSQSSMCDANPQQCTQAYGPQLPSPSCVVNVAYALSKGTRQLADYICSSLATGKQSGVFLDVGDAWTRDSMEGMASHLNASCRDQIEHPVYFPPARRTEGAAFAMKRALLANPAITTIVSSSGSRSQTIAQWLQRRFGNYSTAAQFSVYDIYSTSLKGESVTLSALESGSVVASLNTDEQDPNGHFVTGFLQGIDAWASGVTSVPNIVTAPRLVAREPGAIILSRILNGYHKSLAPHWHPSVTVGEKTSVTVGFTFEHLGEVSEKGMNFKFAGWLHTSWLDPRLTYSSRDLLWLKSVSADSDTVWDPYVAIVAIPDTVEHVKHTEGGLKMRIHPGGRVTKSVWISARVSCNMDLARYPADTQRCQFVSFSPTGAASVNMACLTFVCRCANRYRLKPGDIIEWSGPSVGPFQDIL